MILVAGDDVVDVNLESTFWAVDNSSLRLFHRFLGPKTNAGNVNRKTLIPGLAIIFGLLGNHAPAQDSPHRQHDHAGASSPSDQAAQMPGMQHSAASSQPRSCCLDSIFEISVPKLPG